MTLPIPNSLYNPKADTAAERRFIAGATADNLGIGAVATPNGYDFVDGGAGNDSIVRNDGLSWVDFGAVVGKSITVANATTVANNGTYPILAISTTTTADDTIEIATASLTADTDDNTATFTIPGVPAAIVGLHTRNHRYLHVTALSRVGTSFVVTLYVRCKFSGEWALATWWETGGSATVVTADGALVSEPLLIAGIDEVFVRVHTFSGSAEADVWLAGSSF